MSWWNSSFVLLAACAWAQTVDPRQALRIDIPAGAPVALVASDWGDSKAQARGGAMVLDLHTALTLKNTSGARIRGIMLQVLAQEVTPGGKGSVAVPSLDIGPGESFPVRIDLRLLRPLTAGMAALATVSVDGVLFDNLSFYGPNRLNSRRAMTAWELEARRDRAHLKAVLARGGAEGLKEEMLAALARQTDRPRLDVHVARGRVTNYTPERELQFAFLKLPDAPVEPVAGTLALSQGEVRAPRIEVRNKSNRPVKYLEMCWILQDAQGREYQASSLPASLELAPGASGKLFEDTAVRFSRGGGAPLAIGGMTGYVATVEFADGSVWVPARAALADARLRNLVPASPEEQRLVELYRKKGLAALVEELKKF
jgi:hypothetical protein